jgi:hypothetical protein
MELVAILRILWDRRIVVALGVVVAVAAGMLAGRQSQGDAGGASGVGYLRMVLDTSDSQLVEAAPKGAESLPTRATLLADTLATDTGTSIVARAAGVPREHLVVLGPAATRTPVVDSPLVARVGEAAAVPAAPYVVDVIADGQTPIVLIGAQAPDRARAARLARAAAAGLRSLLLRKDGTRSRGFVLDTVTPLVTKAVVSRPRTRLAMTAAAAATFGCWCVCVVLGAGIAGRMRRRRTAARPA